MGTHRVIKNMDENEEEVKEKLEKYFVVSDYANLEELEAALEKNEDAPHVFGYIGNTKYLLVEPKNNAEIVGLIDGDNSSDWKNLDVSVLHAVVFEKILSIGKAEGNIIYVHEAKDADTLVKEGKGVGAFLVNATRVDQLKQVALNAEMMPQKSTYFYPKLLTGLVVNKFE